MIEVIIEPPIPPNVEHFCLDGVSFCLCGVSFGLASHPFPSFVLLSNHISLSEMCMYITANDSQLLRGTICVP